MALLLLRNEAACLVPDMKTELVSSRVPPELSRSPLPRERFRPMAELGHCQNPGLAQKHLLPAIRRGQHPESGATWSGRGRAPHWLADQDREKFVIAD